MPYIAVDDKEINAKTMQEGFQLMLLLFMPLLTEQAKRDIPDTFRIFSVESAESEVY